MKNSSKNIIKSLAILLIIFSLGFGAGRITGFQIIKGVLKGSKAVFLFYRPPFEFIYSANLLSSFDELKRLEGYYSLLDNKVIDADSLIERYKEETVFIKPTIIWLLGYSGEKDKVLQFISDEYANINSDNRIKSEILKTMLRLDKEYYNKFSESNKIK